jgi:hypothetical protein
MLPLPSIGTRVGLMRRLSVVVPLNFERVQNLMATSPSSKPSVVIARLECISRPHTVLLRRLPSIDFGYFFRIGHVRQICRDEVSDERRQCQWAVVWFQSCMAPFGPRVALTIAVVSDAVPMRCHHQKGCPVLGANFQVCRLQAGSRLVKAKPVASPSLSSTQSLQHDANFLFRRILSRPTSDVLKHLFCRRFARPGFLLHLRSLRLR